MNVVKTPSSRITKDQAAQALGIKTYDTALPQQWLDKFVDTLKDTPTAQTKGQQYVSSIILSSVVWSYDDAKIFGRPHPLTIPAFGWLKCHDQVAGTRYADDTFNVLDIT